MDNLDGLNRWRDGLTVLICFQTVLSKLSSHGEIVYSCNKCRNVLQQPRDTLREHLIINSFKKIYTISIQQRQVLVLSGGETSNQDATARREGGQMKIEIFFGPEHDDDYVNKSSMIDDTFKFQGYMEDASRVILCSFHIKCLNEVTEKRCYAT